MAIAMKLSSDKFCYKNFEGYCLISCPIKISQETIEELNTALKANLLKPKTLFLFDLEGVVDIDIASIRSLSSFAKLLKDNERYMAMLNVDEEIERQLIDSGLKSLLNPVKSKNEALEMAGLRKKLTNFNFEFIHPFVEATSELMKKQLGVNVSAGKPYASVPSIGNNCDIAGLINLELGGLRGAVALCFKSEVFLKFYECLLGETPTEINEEVESGASEMLNIIYGLAKKDLTAKGYSMEMAIPTVMVGKNMRISFKTREKAVILPFNSEHGEFRLEILIME